MSFDPADGALLGIDVRHVVVGGEARDSLFPVFVRHTGLKEAAPRTFDDSSIGAFNHPVCLGAVWVRNVMSDTEFPTDRV